MSIASLSTAANVNMAPFDFFVPEVSSNIQVSAGTSDIPVAEEAAVTVETPGNRVDRFLMLALRVCTLLNNTDKLTQANTMSITITITMNDLRDIEALIDESDIAQSAKDFNKKIFREIAAAEAKYTLKTFIKYISMKSEQLILLWILFGVDRVYASKLHDGHGLYKMPARHHTGVGTGGDEDAVWKWNSPGTNRC